MVGSVPIGEDLPPQHGYEYDNRKQEENPRHFEPENPTNPAQRPQDAPDSLRNFAAGLAEHLPGLHRSVPGFLSCGLIRAPGT